MREGGLRLLALRLCRLTSGGRTVTIVVKLGNLGITNRHLAIGNWKLEIPSVVALQNRVLHVNHRMGFGACHAPQQQGLVVHLR